MGEACVFCDIASGKIPVRLVFEDDEFVAFPDRNPQAPVHALVAPKRHFASLLDAPDARFLGKALLAARATASALGLADEGFRIVVNTGENGGQTIFHLHLHVLGGRFMQWPPG